MKSPLILLTGAILLTPVAVLAADPQAVPAPTAKAAPDANRQICKSEDVVGSLIAKKKICMSAAEWKEKAVRDGQWTERQTMQSTHGNQ